MLTQQTIEYFKQLEISIGDKLRMWPHIRGPKVLDAGCGSGTLMKLAEEDGYSVKGIDSSLVAFDHIKKRNMEKSFVHGDVIDMDIYFAQEEFDTIIFSSVLHEVYSYNEFKQETVFEVLRNAYKLLRPGGRLIIRDGVKPNSCSTRIIRFKDRNDVLFLQEYCRRFKGKKIQYSKIDAVTYEMNEVDAMEFLYTYTWGWDSFDREVQEMYGVFSIKEYCRVIAELLPEATIKLAESYLQHGYQEGLAAKIDYLDDQFAECTLPDSNMLLVLEKG